MALTNISTGELVTAAWLNAIVDRVNAFLISVTGGIWTGTVQNVIQSFRGLHLRTHPNALAAPFQVALLKLDEVVMSDGARYLPTSFPLTADVTVSGLGGLDTGTEAASAWYEVHLIGKSSTGANADLRMMLHRARTYTIDQQQTTGAASSSLRSGPTTNIKLAQSFQVSSSGPLPFIDISIGRTGSLTGTFWITVEASSGGNPSGTALATSDKLDAGAVPATATQWIRFPFRSSPTFTSATTYYIVLQGDYATNGTAYVAWNQATTNVYANGQHYTFNGSSWTATATADFQFKVAVTLNDTALTMPTGYDQSVKLGYVYNNASSNFVAFTAYDRDVKRLTSSAGANDWGLSTSNVPLLMDLSSLVPPVRVILRNSGQATVAGLGMVAAGVPDGYSTLALYGDSGSSFVSVPAANYAFDMPDVYTEYQGAYTYITGGAATGHIYLTGWRWI